MLIAQIEHIGEAGAASGSDPAIAPRSASTTAAWVAEFLDEPLSPDAIDSILAAVLV
jgi:hypothetical protein